MRAHWFWICAPKIQISLICLSTAIGDDADPKIADRLFLRSRNLTIDDLVSLPTQLTTADHNRSEIHKQSRKRSVARSGSQVRSGRTSFGRPLASVAFGALSHENFCSTDLAFAASSLSVQSLLRSAFGPSKSFLKTDSRLRFWGRTECSLGVTLEIAEGVQKVPTDPDEAL